MVELPYLSFFHLTEEPFSTSPNPRFLYVSPIHNAALQKTTYVVSAKKGLAICFGDTGTGKTTLARLLAQRFADDSAFIPVLVTNPHFPTPNQLLRAIIQEFEVPRSAKSYLDLMNILKAFLAEQTLQHSKTPVLIIDEAQTMKLPLLELLRQLMNYESNDQKFLQIVLFAQNEFRSRLKDPRARNLQNRIVMSSTLENLSIDDTTEMLRFRWTVAGGASETFPFLQEAITAIYEYSQGVPRLQVILADNALLAASLQQRKTIGRDVIRSIIESRGLADNEEPTPLPQVKAKPSERTLRAQRAKLRGPNL